MNEEPTLFDPPAHARDTDPITSHAAASSIMPGLRRMSQAAILLLLRDYGPMADPLMCEMYAERARRGLVPPQSESGLRTRRSELRMMGLVRDSGETVTLPSGRKAIVWEVTPEEPQR